LNTLFDVNLGGQYEITDKFSGFLNINNILNNERERFNNYPSVGLNFLAGIILKY